METPPSQLGASTTSGTVEERRPPKINAEIGTPWGSSQRASIEGHCEAATVKRAFGCAAARPQPGTQSLPCQSVSRAGGSLVMSSHHTSPSGDIGSDQPECDEDVAGQRHLHQCGDDPR